MLVYGEFVSGGFFLFGLMVDYIYVLLDVQVWVMDLCVMVWVIKQLLDRLQVLSQILLVFVLGVENYVVMGVVELLWEGDFVQYFLQVLCMFVDGDCCVLCGVECGGCMLVVCVVEVVSQGDV